MAKREYKILLVVADRGGDEVARMYQLNEHTKEGWQVVSVLRYEEHLVRSSREEPKTWIIYEYTLVRPI